MNDSDPLCLPVRALGVPIGIRARAADLPRLRAQWGRALHDGADPESLVGPVEREEGDHDGHDYEVTTRVTRAALEATAGTRLNLHAGGVADDQGRVLAVVGASGAGKTTAIRALAARLGYVSDETISIEPAPPYAVHAHPKPLSVIVHPDDPRRKSQHGPDELGLRPIPDALHLHRLVVLHRSGRIERPERYDATGLVIVPLVETLMDVIPQTSSLALLDDPLLTLARVLLHCGTVALEYDEIDLHIDELEGLIDLTLDEPEPEPAHHPGGATSSPGQDQWVRVPWTDALDFGAGVVVVLLGGVAHRLDGPAAHLWLAAERPCGFPALLAETVAALGPHPDGETIARDALAVLQENGIMVAGSAPSALRS